MTPTWPAYKLTRYNTYLDRLTAGLENVAVPDGMVLSFVMTRVHWDRTEVVKMAIPHLPELPDHLVHEVVVTEYESALQEAHPHGPPQP